jgi:hypothetical protein
MNTNKASAIIIGVLFIAATTFYMIGQSIHGPITASSDYLEHVYPDQQTVIAGVLIELIGILAIPMIAVFFYPVLRKYSQVMSLGYLVFRSLEALLLLVVSIYTLSLIHISKGFLGLTGANGMSYLEIGASVQAMSHWTFLLSVSIVFPLTALMLNAVLYQSRLVPRFISVWGILAAMLLLTGAVVDVFGLLSGISRSALEVILTVPIAANEIVLALWLIIKGFYPADESAGGAGRG